jgi:glycopeptide antibiotics resistance protein
MRSPRTFPGGAPFPRAALQVLAAAYVAFVLAVTLLPIQWSSELSRWPDNRHPQLVPVAPVVADVLGGQHRLLSIAQVGGNLLLFLPAGLLLPLVVGWLDRGSRVVLAALGSSAAIELYQLRMPGIRRADVNDVLANTLGAALGWLALRMVERWLAAGGRPTLRRLARPDQAERIPP